MTFANIIRDFLNELRKCTTPTGIVSMIVHYKMNGFKSNMVALKGDSLVVSGRTPHVNLRQIPLRKSWAVDLFCNWYMIDIKVKEPVYVISCDIPLKVWSVLAYNWYPLWFDSIPEVWEIG